MVSTSHGVSTGTEQMTIILNPMIENNSAKIEQVARQVNELAGAINRPFNPLVGNFGRGVMLAPNPPSMIVQREEDPNKVVHGVGENDYVQAYGQNVIQAIEQMLSRVGLNIGTTNEPYFISPFFD
ncbi:hypothetical protein PIB30_049695 [Stylosanthes scabra]|uniref:Uncharacterized protein n=1 Tax=Stylosanthes scabra TaxID=79078 RepID=A0ABU6YJ67_9FABA|nr:hypothetical protein [Stylosanthes scabra]